ncbi:MAG: DNA adenine methylase [bacterium]
MTASAPFPWFGGKSRVADVVWRRFGDVPNYVEPFFGSGAVLLGRPHDPRTETVNDKDGFVCNFWRAVQHDAEAVAHYADNPVNENDLHARHAWLVPQRDDLTARLEGDPDYHDAKIAGWWVWGLCCWIGSGWCSGKGPWSVDSETRQLVRLGSDQGVNRQLAHLGSVRGVNRQLALVEWMQALSDRFQRVRVCCGDWSRVVTHTPTWGLAVTAVFLDPPYSHDEYDVGVYSVDDAGLSDAVREWAIENGDNPLLRIALCGYEGEHTMPASWLVHAWKASGRYRASGNHTRECVWFSPHCLASDRPVQLGFDS